MKPFNQTDTYKLHQIVFCLDKVAIKSLSKNTKITYVQFLILLSIQENPEFRLEKIGNWVNLTKSAVSQQVEKLVKLGFLNRVESPEDRREKKLTLTEEGHKEVDNAKDICNEISESLFNVLDTDDRVLFESILNKLAGPDLKNFLSKYNQK